MLRFNLTIEREDEVLAEFSAPNFTMLCEKVGAWDRKNRREERESLEEKIDPITF